MKPSARGLIDLEAVRKEAWPLFPNCTCPRFHDKIPLHNGVNLINGYDTLSINTPAEVITYED